MSDRNWEQELAKIDKQLASVSDEQLLQQTAQNAQGAPQRAPLTAPSAAKGNVAAKASVADKPARTARSWFAWVQLGLAVAAGTGLWFWPWGTRCGLNAVAFTGATGAVTLLGLWSAIGSWRHRQSYAHVLSFAVMVWGLVLGAREVLPRIGYAIPTLDRPGGWSCEAPSGIQPIPSTLPTTKPDAIPAPTPSTVPPGTQPTKPPG